MKKSLTFKRMARALPQFAFPTAVPVMYKPVPQQTAPIQQVTGQPFIQFEKQGNPFVNFIDKIFALKQAAAVEPKDPVQYEIAKVCRIVGVMAASVFWVHWARVRFLYNPINFFISAYDEFALWQNVSKGCGRRVENSNE